MTLSIIVPTRGRSDSLDRLKASLAAHTTHTYELIVVDHEAGMNAKRNYGARRATGDFLVFLHDDIEATAGWDRELAPVGAFCYGELGDSFDCWGGEGGGYCTDPTHTPDYTDFFLLSRAAYAQIGPFDEAYAEPGYQDADFGRQVQAAGYTFTCLPGKLIHHHLRTAPLAPANQAHYERKWA